MDNNLFELYTLAEMRYEKKLMNMVNSIEELYPAGWYEKKDYKGKIEIILEAIETNSLIVNTKLYQERLEGVQPKVRGLTN